MPFWVWRVLACGIVQIYIFTLWKTQTKIMRNGVVLPAVIVRHKWHRIVLRYDIVRFNYQGKDIELETSVSLLGLKKIGFQLEIIYWDRMPERLAIKDTNYVARYVEATIFNIAAFVFCR